MKLFLSKKEETYELFVRILDLNGKRIYLLSCLVILKNSEVA